MAMKVLVIILAVIFDAAIPVHTEEANCTLLETSLAADHVKNNAMSWNFRFPIPQQVSFYQLEFLFFGTTTAPNCMKLKQASFVMLQVTV